MPQGEPIFSRQEQGVVYLFSRYWDRIPHFSNKRIVKIHTHFPDFSLVDKNGKEEAIEFEYGLNDFRSHLNSSLRRLSEEGCRHLYVVYWDDDGDGADLQRQIRRRGFRHKISLVCLKDYFTASVRRSRLLGKCRAAWTFPRTKVAPAYRLSAIESELAKLEREGAITRRPVNKGVYRTLGFNKNGSSFIECDHWQSIRFFTTTSRFQETRVPRKLFFRPRGSPYFYGYLDIKHAFVINKGSRRMKRFFQRYYFYTYDEDYHTGVTCFVYRAFHRFDVDRGRKLYRHLARLGYNLGVRGSQIIKDRHRVRVDRVCRGA